MRRRKCASIAWSSAVTRLLSGLISAWGKPDRVADCVALARRPIYGAYMPRASCASCCAKAR
ncbi:hypothetical protein D3C73_1479350 [compost metagenome]